MATGIVIALVVWARFGPAPAGAFAAGCAWSLANVLLLRVLARLVFGSSDRRGLAIAALLVVKVPVLYGIGYALLLWERFPAGWLLGGFGWPLCVIALKAAGRMLMGLDRKDPALDAAGPFEDPGTPARRSPGARRTRGGR